MNSHNVSVEFNLFLGNCGVGVPYVASLHGGYETVPELLTPDFIAYLQRTVTVWLHLAEKNRALLFDRRYRSSSVSAKL